MCYDIQWWIFNLHGIVGKFLFLQRFDHTQAILPEDQQSVIETCKICQLYRENPRSIVVLLHISYSHLCYIFPQESLQERTSCEWVYCFYIPLSWSRLSLCYSYNILSLSPHILQPAQVFWVFVTRKGSSNTKLSRQNRIRQNGIRWSRNKLFFSWKGGGLGVRLEWYHLLKWTWKFTSLAVTLHISFQQPDSQFSAHNKTLNFLHAKVIQAIFVTPLCYSHFYPTIRCHLFCNLTHLSLVPYTIQTDKPQSSLLTNIQGFTVFSCITSPVSC